jgi:hypothetical protein
MRMLERAATRESTRPAASTTFRKCETRGKLDFSLRKDRPPTGWFVCGCVSKHQGYRTSFERVLSLLIQ